MRILLILLALTICLPTPAPAKEKVTTFGAWTMFEETDDATGETELWMWSEAKVFDTGKGTDTARIVVEPSGVLYVQGLGNLKLDTGSDSMAIMVDDHPPIRLTADPDFKGATKVIHGAVLHQLVNGKVALVRLSYWPALHARNRFSLKGFEEAFQHMLRRLDWLHRENAR